MPATKNAYSFEGRKFTAQRADPAAHPCTGCAHETPDKAPVALRLAHTAACLSAPNCSEKTRPDRQNVIWIEQL